MTPRRASSRSRCGRGACLALLLGAALDAHAADPQFARPSSGVGADFSLIDHDGLPYRLRDARGKVVLLAFGYTHCPDVCPMTLSTMAQVLGLLGANAARVAPLLVSLDPARDAPRELGQYVTHFHPAIVGLTGSHEALQAVADAFKARAVIRRDPESGRFTIDHTTALYLLDADGRVAEIIPSGLPARYIRERVLALLDAPQEAPQPHPR
jgi:cytochrome oxidase Cu insertion factor (SCO1/SenC/PrrC family)